MMPTLGTKTHDEFKRTLGAFCLRLGVPEGSTGRTVLNALDGVLERSTDMYAYVTNAVQSGRIPASLMEFYHNAARKHPVAVRLMINAEPPGRFDNKAAAERPSEASIESLCSEMGLTRAEFDLAARDTPEAAEMDRARICEQMGLSAEEFDGAGGEAASEATMAASAGTCHVGGSGSGDASVARMCELMGISVAEFQAAASRPG